MRWLTITVSRDGFALTHQGLDEFEVAACHAVMRLRPRHDEQTRAWIAECCGVVPTIRHLSPRAKTPSPMPSVAAIAGEDA